MKQNNQFTNRLQDLEENFEHPEDFFNLMQGDQEAYAIKPRNQMATPQQAQKDNGEPVTSDEWLQEDQSYEGQLAVDVYQKDDKIMVQAAMAGVKPENVEVTLNNDTLTIKGKRESKHQKEGSDYFIEECYWGGFSRSIILPVDVKQDEIEALFENGILTVALPIAKKSKHTKIEIKEIK